MKPNDQQPFADELETLRAAWREQAGEGAAKLRDRVARETRRIRVYAAFELLISVVAMGGTLWMAIAEPTPEFVALAIGVWIFTLAALTSSWRNRAGTWAAAEQDTREFLRLSLRRSQSGSRAIRLAFAFLAVETVMLVLWFVWYYASHTPRPGLATWLVAACVPLGFLIALLVLRRRRLRQHRRLQDMRRELFP